MISDNTVKLTRLERIEEMFEFFKNSEKIVEDLEKEKENKKEEE